MESNPLLNEKMFLKNASMHLNNHMTLDGTINKSFLLLILLFISAAFSWVYVPNFPEYVTFIIISSMVVGFILALVTIFKKEVAMYTAPAYAIVEGVLLGAISFFFEQIYPGIVIQAVLLTFGVLFLMLFLYKYEIIKVTQKFRAGVTSAIGAIFLVYVSGFFLRLFGIRFLDVLFGSGMIGMGFGIFVVAIASLTLVLDFDMIVKGAKAKLPVHMEWYCGFSLMVTLIWLYLEILRLLSRRR